MMLWDLHVPPLVRKLVPLDSKESVRLVVGHVLHLAPLLVTDSSVQGRVGPRMWLRAKRLLLKRAVFRVAAFLVTIFREGASSGVDDHVSDAARTSLHLAAIVLASLYPGP